MAGTDKLEAMLRTSGAVTASDASLVADLLSLPTKRYPPLELSPPERKAATLAALVDLLTGLARAAPVLLLLEDAHWIDPTTKELWIRLIDRISASRMLALVTARPEFVSPWKERSQASSLELSRLTPTEAAALVAATAAPRALERAQSRARLVGGHDRAGPAARHEPMVRDLQQLVRIVPRLDRTRLDGP